MTIDLNPTPDQQEIVSSVGKVLRDHFPVSRLRSPSRAGTPGASPDPMEVLAELGLFGLGLPEAAGGAGFSEVEEALAFVELGRHLVHPDAAAALLAARLAHALGLAELTRDIVSGRQPVCLATALAPLDFGAPDGLPVHLLGLQPGGLALLWSEAGMLLLRGDSIGARAVTGTDRSIPLLRGDVCGDAVIARLEASRMPLPHLAHLLVSAMLLGMAEACRDMAVEYAKTREQFGRPIGAFQAIKHRCANMAIGAEALRAQLAFAALALRDGWPDVQLQLDACRLLAARCALTNAGANIQVHGGLGFTAECDAHLYLLRAHLYEHLGGPIRATRARLARPLHP